MFYVPSTNVAAAAAAPAPAAAVGRQTLQ